MIIGIRERVLKSNIFKAVLWALILILGGIFTLPSLLRESKGASVISINGHEISERDFGRKVWFWKEQIDLFKQQYGQYADVFLQAMGLSANPVLLARESAIRDELLNQEASRLGLYLHEGYITEKLSDALFVRQALSELVPMHALDPVRGINAKQLQTYLREQQISMTDFESKVQEALRRALFIELMLGSSYVPAFEVKEQYSIDQVSKQFSILSFVFSDYLKKEKDKPVSAQEIQQFFEIQSKQLKRYWIPEKRTGISWRFSPNNYDITVTDQDIADYYEDNKTNKFVERAAQIGVRTILFAVTDKEQELAVQKKAQAVQEELKNNPDLFAQKARELSDDKEAASKGGMMPLFAKGVHESTFEKAAFLLKKDGDISGVIRTKKGFEIVQRVSKDPIAYKALGAVKKEITETLLKQKFAHKFVKDIERMIQETTVDDKELASFVALKKATPVMHSSVEKDGSKVAAELFDLKENEYAVYVDGDAGVVIKLTGIQKKYLPALDAIKEVVTGDFHEDRALKALKKDMESARQLAGSQSLQELSVAFGASLEKTGLLKKNDTESLKSLKAKGLPAEEMFQVEKVGMVKQLHGERNGYLVRLDTLGAQDEADFKVKSVEIAGELARERKEFLGQGFVASLYRTATINVNETRFKQE